MRVVKWSVVSVFAFGVAVVASACSSAKGTECVKLESCCGSDSSCKNVVGQANEANCKTTQALYCSSTGDGGGPATCETLCQKKCPATAATCTQNCKMGMRSDGKCAKEYQGVLECLQKSSASLDCANLMVPADCKTQGDAVTACANKLCGTKNGDDCTTSMCCDTGAGTCGTVSSTSTGKSCCKAPQDSCGANDLCCGVGGELVACQSGKCCVAANGKCGSNGDCCSMTCTGATCM